MTIPRKTILWFYFVFALKLLTTSVSFLSHRFDWNWVPYASTPVILVALAFVVSSLVFLTTHPKLGLASSVTFGALTAYSAVASLIEGQYIAWSSFGGLTGLALVFLAVYGWQQLSSVQSSKGSSEQ